MLEGNCSAFSACPRGYEAKTTSFELKTDPYCIEEWTEAPETIPKVQWIDVMVYMVSTPSPYTREEIKVSAHDNAGWFTIIGLEGNA